ncbi:MAG: YwiC-like family protein [Gemmatimonadales bacterium]|nr:YwiC-like family protein [Gemmatimonadales bacterium]
MTNPRSLWPREHGAYAALGFPILTGLTVGVPTVTALAVASAAVALFLAHEPVAVLTGMRGERLQTEAGDRARVRLTVLIGLGLVLGLVGMGTASADVRLAVCVPAAALLALVPWVVRRRQKTFGGELMVIVAFATTVVPISIAVGASWRLAWTAGVVWLVSFGLGTFAVHALKLRHKQGADAGWVAATSLVLAVAVVTTAVAGALLGRLPVPIAVALLPPAILVIGLALFPVHPRRLKRVGWSLVSANGVTWICLLLW